MAAETDNTHKCMGCPSLLHRFGEYSATAVAPGELTSLSQEVDGEGVLVNSCLQDLSLQAGHCVSLLKTCRPAVLRQLRSLYRLGVEVGVVCAIDA